MKTKLDEIFTAEKQAFTYIYDFGDDWVHQIVLEKILSDEIKHPVCLAGKGACPPEDCGGPWGYENIKQILANPSHEEYEDMTVRRSTIIEFADEYGFKPHKDFTSITRLCSRKTMKTLN